MDWRYTVFAEADVLAQHDQEMAALVKARNELIHGFLPRWEAATDGDYQGALDHLDAQHTQLTTMYDRLDQWARNLAAALLTTGEFLQSDEVQRVVELALLLASGLIQALVNFARRHHDADGWVALAAANKHIGGAAPRQLHDLEKRFGHPDLRTIVKASGVFELQKRPGSAGQKRTHFRVNDPLGLLQAFGGSGSEAND